MNTLIALCAALSLAALPALAQGRGQGQGPKHCPPGLAKKNPPCIPPGLVGKFGIGETLTDDVWWDPINDWQFYNLPEPAIGEIYIEVEGGALKILQDTMTILQILDGWSR